VLLVLVGHAATKHAPKYPVTEGSLELLLGVALVIGAFVVARRPDQVRRERGSGRSSKLLARLQHIRPASAFVVGVALGVGGPKRLVLTALASTSILIAHLGGAAEGALVIWYGVLATIVVWVPVVLGVVMGDRAIDLLDDGIGWLQRHRRTVTLVVLLGVGAYLIVHGLVLLITGSG
jgi:hypothetical protein